MPVDNRQRAEVPKSLQSDANISFIKQFKTVSKIAKVLQAGRFNKQQELNTKKKELASLDELLQMTMQGMGNMLKQAPEIEPQQHGQEEVIL